MSAKTGGLRALKQRDVALIMVVLSVVLALAWYFYMYRPAQEKILDLQDEIGRIEVEVRRGEEARRNLPALREAIAELEVERVAFLGQLPTESDVAGIIDNVRVSASSSEATIKSFSQSGSSENIQDVRPIGFSVNLDGTFGQTMDFLSELENLQRYTKVERVTLSLSDAADADPKLSSNFDFVVYVYTGTDPGGQ